MSQLNTEYREQEAMNISSNIIRQLRHERGWSQEQLALASGLSLRTIQRVETEERASRETRVCLAATFNVALSELLEPVDVEEAAQPALPVRRYKIALVIACIMLAPVLSGLSGVISIGPLVSICFMAAIALFLYAGFGLYFTGEPRHPSGIKRYAQMAFIAAAIFCAFAFFARNNSAAVGLAGQVVALVMGIYFLFDYVRFRRHTGK